VGDIIMDGSMKLKARNWGYAKASRTGKSVLVVYNDSDYGVIYDFPCAPNIELGYGILTNDIREWEVSEIHPMPEGTTWEVSHICNELLSARCAGFTSAELALTPESVNHPLPYPEPGVYWVKFKPCWEGDEDQDWQVAEFKGKDFDSPSDSFYWHVLGNEERSPHSTIKEIGPRVLPPRPPMNTCRGG